jgi:2-C-methyl-D-erythritol 4-phosphate cytidylyltransferase
MSASPPDSSDACCDRRDVTAVILAAGSGTRLGGIAKATLAFRGRTLLRHAIESVAPFAAQAVIGVRAGDLRWAEAELARIAFDGRVLCLAGGATRQETLERLIARCETRYVLVHEVARPWVTADDFRRLLSTVKRRGAVALFTPLPVRDGLALAHDGRLRRTLPRSQVVSVQAPHAYRRSVLARAYALAGRHGWNEESTIALMCRARRRVALVEGSPRNVKVTYPEDLSPLETYPQPGPPQPHQACGG